MMFSADKLVLCSAIAYSVSSLFGCGSEASDVTSGTTTTWASGSTAASETTIATTATTTPGPSNVSAFHPLIRYVGRTRQDKEDGSMLMDWPGVHATVRFRGTSLQAHLAGPSSNYIVAEVDGVHSKKMTVKTHHQKAVTIAEGLTDGEHVATVWKVDESDDWGSADSALKLYGFSSKDDVMFFSPPELKKRKLDIWGASMTAGYCADGPPGPEPRNHHIYSNYYATWARQIAHMLDADHQCEAMSGVGILRGFDGPHAVLSNYLESSVVTTDTDYDWSNWKPDAVLMFLGTNDPDHKSEKFHEAFANLFQHMVDIYTKLEIKPKFIHITEPSICKDTAKDIEAFNKLHGDDGFQAFEVCFSEEAWHKIFSKNTQHYQGCDNHPNLAGGKMLAEDILPTIEKILGGSSTEVV